MHIKEQGKFVPEEKAKPTLLGEEDTIVRVTLASIGSSNIHIKRGAVPRTVQGITVGHEMVGSVEEVGSKVTKVKPGDRVTVNVETFCGKCFFCDNGYGSYYWRRTNRNLYTFGCNAEAAEKYYIV